MLGNLRIMAERSPHQAGALSGQMPTPSQSMDARSQLPRLHPNPKHGHSHSHNDEKGIAKRKLHYKKSDTHESKDMVPVRTSLGKQKAPIGMDTALQPPNHNKHSGGRNNKIQEARVK